MAKFQPESPEARALAAIAKRVDGPPLDRAWRVTINFHPDRMFGDLLVLSVLARDGVLRSQFETRTSNGGLTAYEGGDRWRWTAGLRPS